MQHLTADLNWAAQRLEDTNPDRGYEFSEGVDWAVAELRTLAIDATQTSASEPTDAAQRIREETLRLAAEYLRKKYGVTNRAAGDLLRLAELEAQGRSALPAATRIGPKETR